MRRHNAADPRGTRKKTSRNATLPKRPRQSRGYGDLVVIGAYRISLRRSPRPQVR
jgi:hypothetical protein